MSKPASSSAPASRFEDLFGRPPAVRASAPGRVNLIGEHTDYNGGFVLPTVIPQRTVVELLPRGDQHVRVWSREVPHRHRVQEFTLGSEKPGRGWLDYVQGVTRVLQSAGFALNGFDARIASDVPLGSGLSSSAALEVALLRALRDAFDLDLDDVPLALLGRRAENEFVGAPVGIMDQMAAALADAGTALFLDTRSLAYERVPIPAGAELVVINSGIAHRHATGDYATRRGECERAAGLLGVRELRDLTPADVPRAMALADPLGRRARHVLTEDERVLAAVRAMRAGDLRRLGDLFYESHQSMRDDYQVSIPEIDRLVDIARRQADVFGARLTGGGFGGSVVVLARAGSGEAVARAMAAEYEADTGQRASVLVPPPDSLSASPFAS